MEDFKAIKQRISWEGKEQKCRFSDHGHDHGNKEGSWNDTVQCAHGEI